MVKIKNHKKLVENTSNKGELLRLGANTPYGMCKERISAFGGLMSLVKFMDLIRFKDVFREYYQNPDRVPSYGCFRLIYGILMLLFIGFQRLGHFDYIRRDGFLCGILKVQLLPAVSTFWRYLMSLGAKQCESILVISGILRSRVWQLCGLSYSRVHINIDTTTTTVFGSIEKSSICHNPRNPGKKGLRPFLCFIEETREYVYGTQRPGASMSRSEAGHGLRRLFSYLPNSVKKVLIKGDAEFMGWASIEKPVWNAVMILYSGIATVNRPLIHLPGTAMVNTITMTVFISQKPGKSPVVL